MLGSATAASYEATVPILLADPAVDSVIVLFVPPATAGAEDVAEGLARTLESVSTDKPVLAALLSAEGIPATLPQAPAPAALFTYPESAARALGLAAAACGVAPPAGWDGSRTSTGSTPPPRSASSRHSRRVDDAG